MLDPKTINFHTLLSKRMNLVMGQKILDPFQRCFELAMYGLGRVSPNPLVGAIVIDDQGCLMGYGFHEHVGGHHAEVNAINMAKQHKQDLSSCSIYVSLQPCTHHGRTPPCADLIKSENIKKVYYLYDDPNPMVENSGDFIKQASPFEESYKDLIAPFLFTIKNKNRPFIAIKTAVSKDGYIAEQGDSRRWVTNKLCREYGHLLRNCYDGVLVGRKTVELDEPSLQPRLEFMQDKIPWRIILDKNLKTLQIQMSYSEKIKEKTIIVHSSDSNTVFDGVLSIKLKENEYGLNQILRILRNDYGIQSLLVEGGANTHAGFFDSGFVDRVYKFSGDENIKSLKSIPWYQSKKKFEFKLHKKIDLAGHLLEEYTRPDLLSSI